MDNVSITLLKFGIKAITSMGINDICTGAISKVAPIGISKFRSIGIASATIIISGMIGLRAGEYIDQLIDEAITLTTEIHKNIKTNTDKASSI